VTPANTTATTERRGPRREKETSASTSPSKGDRHHCFANRDSRGRRCRLHSATATFTPSPSSGAARRRRALRVYLHVHYYIIITHNDTTPTSSSLLLLLFFALVPYDAYNTHIIVIYITSCFVIVAQYTSMCLYTIYSAAAARALIWYTHIDI